MINDYHCFATFKNYMYGNKKTQKVFFITKNGLNEICHDNMKILESVP